MRSSIVRRSCLAGLALALGLTLLPPARAAAAKAAGKAPADADAALGEKVMTDFCLSCHTLDGASNPLLPKLDRARFGTEEAAYRSIGRLEQLSPSMILEFGGTEQERRALARHLARLATKRAR